MLLAGLQVLAQPLPRCPVEVGTLPHWLAIEGKQPATAENAIIERRKPAAKRTRTAAQLDSTPGMQPCKITSVKMFSPISGQPVEIRPDLSY